MAINSLVFECGREYVTLDNLEADTAKSLIKIARKHPEILNHMSHGQWLFPDGTQVDYNKDEDSETSRIFNLSQGDHIGSIECITLHEDNICFDVLEQLYEGNYAHLDWED